MQRSKPFARSLAMMASISFILSSGLDTVMQQAKLSALGGYKSRGKGKGNGINRHYGRRSGKHYPVSSARQARPKYYTATVNGFQIMQRLPRHLQGT